jgi:hypothetical protein
LFLSGFVQAQTVDRNRISLSAGWTQQIFVNTSYGQTAPTVGLSYGYRPWKLMEFESGIAVGFQPARCMLRRLLTNDRYIWIPVGVHRLPLIRHAGTFAGRRRFDSTWVSNPDNPCISTEQFWRLLLPGRRGSIDFARFWFGATPQVLLANPGIAAGAGSHRGLQFRF